MAARSPPLWILAIALVAVLAAAGAGEAYVYLHGHPGARSGPRVVVEGDNVTVNYVGLFGSGPQSGRVFDTSFESIAKNNLTWPKSLEYQYRSTSAFVPLGVHVGPSTPSGGYSINNTTYGSTIAGFWQGLIGMAENQTRWVTIPPALGYGSPKASCEVTAPLVTKVPTLVSVPVANFTTLYPNASKLAGVEFPDPTYGWPDLVLSVNATSVTVQNLPLLGYRSTTPGWPIAVTNVSGGNISVTNEITSTNVGLVLGHSSTTVCSTSKFIVSAVDPVAGTFTENFNSEVVGQTLIFEMTLVAIQP